MRFRSVRPTRPRLLAGLLGIAIPACATQRTLPPAAPTARADSMRAAPAVALWPGRAPGAVGDSSVDRPTMTPYLPPAGRGNGAAAVVFAGGAYGHISLDKEGAQTARWLTSIGVVAFVVEYRLGPRYHHPAMLQDAQRAIRVVRARAAEWGVDPRRVGVVGFSAGGHLASTAGTRFDAGEAAAADSVERASSRPDFMVLVYPVITMEERFTHKSSRARLLGDDPPPELGRLLSNETQVTRETPPTFLIASTDDASVPAENSLMFYQALKAAGVLVEMHVFESGRHGFALGPGDPALSAWPALAATWMRRHGWLEPAGAPPPAR